MPTSAHNGERLTKHWAEPRLCPWPPRTVGRAVGIRASRRSRPGEDRREQTDVWATPRGSSQSGNHLLEIRREHDTASFPAAQNCQPDTSYPFRARGVAWSLSQNQNLQKVTACFCCAQAVCRHARVLSTQLSISLCAHLRPTSES